MPVIEDLCGALGFPAGRFGTIVADPPWSFSDKGSRAAPDWEAAPIYRTMTAREIYDLPADLLAAESAHLYVWTTDVHLPLALRCVEAWGFVHKKVLVWVKRKSAVTPLRADLEEPGVPGHSEYLRIVERANAHRREARAVTLAKRAKRRAAIRWEGLIPGVTRYSGRCTHCERQICQGDAVYYHPDATGDVCAECVLEWQQGLVGAPAPAPEEAPF